MVKFHVPEDGLDLVTIGIYLPNHNGEYSWVLGMPGQYVIDSGGIIRVAGVNPNYTHRSEPEKIIANLQSFA